MKAKFRRAKRRIDRGPQEFEHREVGSSGFCRVCQGFPDGRIVWFVSIAHATRQYCGSWSGANGARRKSKARRRNCENYSKETGTAAKKFHCISGRVSQSRISRGTNVPLTGPKVAYRRRAQPEERENRRVIYPQAAEQNDARRHRTGRQVQSRVLFIFVSGKVNN